MHEESIEGLQGAEEMAARQEALEVLGADLAAERAAAKAVDSLDGRLASKARPAPRPTPFSPPLLHPVPFWALRRCPTPTSTPTPTAAARSMYQPSLHPQACIKRRFAAR